jgi:hypothetical protein
MESLRTRRTKKKKLMYVCMEKENAFRDKH